MKHEEELQAIEDAINTPAPEHRRCMNKSNELGDNEFCVYCGEEHPPVLTERQKYHVACIIETALRGFEDRLVQTLEYKIDLVGKELYKSTRRETKLYRLLKEELGQLRGHFTNLEKRVFNTEKQPIKKRKYKEYREG